MSELANDVSTEDFSKYFQAIGVIKGEIKFEKLSGKQHYRAFISFDNREYLLSGGVVKIRALKKEVEATGETQRLVVYPKAIHYPKPRDKQQQPHKIVFQLVSYGKDNEVLKEFRDNEFKLCGIWQFIPVCKCPCVSVMRNYTDERKEFIKSSEPWIRVLYMKSTHLPLFWRDSIVNAFRFNPRLKPEEQEKPRFIQVKAKFLPHKNSFGFDSVIGLPTEEIPRFLKANKKDKATVLKMKQSKRKEREQQESQPKTA